MRVAVEGEEGVGERRRGRVRDTERARGVVTYMSTTALIAEPYWLTSRSSSAASKSFAPGPNCALYSPSNVRVPSSLKCFTPAGMRIAPPGPAAAPPPEAMARSLRGLGKIPSAWIGLWVRVRPSHTQDLVGGYRGAAAQDPHESET